MAGTLFILSAASGTGKTSLVKRLLSEEPGLSLSVSYTTRQPREGEVDGKDYHFVTQAQFDARLSSGDFLEYATIYGNSYGTSRSAIDAQLKEGDILLEIDWQGALQIMEKPTASLVSIFILPPSLKELENRLRKRGKDDEETILRRLSLAKEEILHASSYQFVIINQDFEEASLNLRSIVRANRLTLDHCRLAWQNLLNT